MPSLTVSESRARRHRRVRGKVAGTAERPRLAVFRSNRGIAAQLIDDEAGRTLASASWLGLPRVVQGRQVGAGDRGRQAARREREEGRHRGSRLRPRRLPVPRTRQGARRRRARGRIAVLMAVDFQETRELKERVVEINRVAKVVKGGRRFSFTALVVVGDEVDRVGVGYGKAREVPLAITKAVEDAKKNLFTVPKHGSTITHEVLGRFDAARVMLPPGVRRYRRHRRRRRARRARARRRAQRAREEPRHDEPDQHGEGDDRRAQGAAPSRGRREDPRQADQRGAAAAVDQDEAAARPGCRSSRRRSAATGVVVARRTRRAPAGAPSLQPRPTPGRRGSPVAEEAPKPKRAAKPKAETPAEPAAEAKPEKKSVAEAAQENRHPRGRPAEAAARLMAKVKITQVRSQIGQSERHRGTLRALGLGKIGRTRRARGVAGARRHAAQGPPSREGRGGVVMAERAAEPHRISSPRRSARTASASAAAPARARASTPAAATRARSRARARTRCAPASRAARCRSTCASASCAARRRRTRCRSARSAPRRCR